jgi:hypothetical protein
MRRHDVDLVSLVAGLMFGVLALFFLSDARTAGSLDGRWLWPIVIIVPGIAMVFAGVRRMLRGAGSDAAEADEDPPETSR